MYCDAPAGVAGQKTVDLRLVFTAEHRTCRIGQPATGADKFSDLIKAGGMRQGGALRQEANEKELAELPRLVFRHERSDFGRLRQLIDAINGSATGEGG